MGTEKAHDIYLSIERYLMDPTAWRCSSAASAATLSWRTASAAASPLPTARRQEIFAAHTVVATGRRGADWLEGCAPSTASSTAPSTVDIGVRVEVRNEVMEEVNDVLYESKLIGYPKPFKNKVRTFCQNPGGFVAQENYDNDLAVVNGHSYKELKSPTTPTWPFSAPTTSPCPSTSP
jgi:uncharacterized FAD-dependent dehydrogenase